MKQVIFFLLSIFYLKSYPFDEAKLIITNVNNMTSIKVSPNGSLIAVGYVNGQIIIYDQQGSLITTINDHSTKIVRIQWLDDAKGPIILSTEGKISFMDDFEGNISIYQIGYELPGDHLSTSWNVSESEQYMAFIHQSSVIEWDILKQVYVGTYTSTLPIKMCTYAEGGKYLVVVTETYVPYYYLSNVTYFDRVTKAAVRVYENFDIMYSLNASKYSNRVAIVERADDTTMFVNEISSNEIIVNTFWLTSICDVLYCGESEIIIGEKGLMRVQNYKSDPNYPYYHFQGYVEGLNVNAKNDYCKRPLYCTNDSLFVLDYDTGIFLAQRIKSLPDDGIPDWIIIVAIAFVSVIVLGCFLLICIKKGLGITAYKCLKRCLKKKSQYDESLYTESNDFGKY